MDKKKLITDVNGREIHVGDRVRYATWGMFDVWIKDKQNSGRKDTASTRRRWISPYKTRWYGWNNTYMY